MYSKYIKIKRNEKQKIIRIVVSFEERGNEKKGKGNPQAAISKKKKEEAEGKTESEKKHRKK